MIASLHGKLESFGSGHAVVNVGGIGFLVHVPASTLSALGPAGSDVRLHTHLHLREDNVTLFGFATPEELALFETILGVSGLGPRLGLAMLSAMSPEHLVTAIATGNADMLTTVPGIGKKVASRIILELKDKIGAGWIAAPATQLARENADVLSALTALGYSAAEAIKAVATLPPAAGEMSLEEKIKLALQQLGG